MTDSVITDFQQAFRGSFTSALRWHHLDSLWARVREDAAGGWFLYALGESVPTEAATSEQVTEFVTEIDALLRLEHQEDYCGIVYADDLKVPRLIKIYDPNHLGVSCGYSDNPPLPGWVMSKLVPVALEQTAASPKNRRRWWQSLWQKTK